MASVSLRAVSKAYPGRGGASTPVLKAMSKDIMHLGPLGSGATMKLMNNFLCGVQAASFAEAIAWLERSGMDRDLVLRFLKGAAPGSPLFSGLSDRMTSRDYTVNFLLRLMHKDLQYAHAMAPGANIVVAVSPTSLTTSSFIPTYNTLTSYEFSPIRKDNTTYSFFSLASFPGQRPTMFCEVTSE